MAHNRLIRVENGSVVESQTMVLEEIINEDGNIDVVIPEMGAGEWILLPHDQHHFMGYEITRLRWDDHLGLSLKKRVQLHVGNHIFPADGVSELAVCIRKFYDDAPEDAPAPDQEVRVLVNGQEYFLTMESDLTLTADQPGSFRIDIADPHVHGVPNSLEVQAVSPEVTDE